MSVSGAYVILLLLSLLECSGGFNGSKWCYESKRNPLVSNYNFANHFDLSTCLVKVICTGSSAGMGTAGLVGQIGTISSMLNYGSDTWRLVVGIVALEIILPGLLVFLIDLLFRKFNLIKEGDLKV